MPTLRQFYLEEAIDFFKANPGRTFKRQLLSDHIYKAFTARGYKSQRTSVDRAFSTLRHDFLSSGFIVDQGSGHFLVCTDPDNPEPPTATIIPITDDARRSIEESLEVIKRHTRIIEGLLAQNDQMHLEESSAICEDQKRSFPDHGSSPLS